jgi:tetratricopeptide (TPR) repeat protein
MYLLHSEASVPKLNYPLFPVIQRCLEKQPNKRYQTFKELRADLEPLLKRQTGETVRQPELKELEAWEWCNKGVSLNSLGRLDESIRFFDKAIEINPRYAEAWNNKGISLHRLGRFDEAIRCYDKAIEINPRQAEVWCNKGLSLSGLGRFAEAIRCCDEALEANLLDGTAWFIKALAEDKLGFGRDAATSYRKFIELAPSQYDEYIEFARQRLREVEGR